MSSLHQKKEKDSVIQSVSHLRNSFSASTMTGNRPMYNYLINEKLIDGMEKDKAKKQ